MGRKQRSIKKNKRKKKYVLCNLGVLLPAICAAAKILPLKAALSPHLYIMFHKKA